jgi:hypothetical protein
MDQEEPRAVVFAGAVADADFARSVLDGHGFTAFILDEAVGTWAPYCTQPGGAGAVRIAVPESQAEAARALLARSEHEGENPDE